MIIKRKSNIWSNIKNKTTKPIIFIMPILIVRSPCTRRPSTQNNLISNFKFKPSAKIKCRSIFYIFPESKSKFRANSNANFRKTPCNSGICSKSGIIIGSTNSINSKICIKKKLLKYKESPV